jgi:hypothetical protein
VAVAGQAAEAAVAAEVLADSAAEVLVAAERAATGNGGLSFFRLIIE